MMIDFALETQRHRLMPQRLHLSMPRPPHTAEMAAIGREFGELRPYGGARLIVADPPWTYENWSERGYSRNASRHYQTQPIDWICDLPVGDLANPRGCLLFLWATNPNLREAFRVLDAWGFAYSTAGTWVKRTVTGKLAFGGGYVFRSSNEPILIGIRGRVPIQTHSQRSVILSDEPGAESPGTLGITIEAVRPDEHSRKPDEGYHAALSLVGEGSPAVELFSRETRPGFVPWGNEVGKFDQPPEPKTAAAS